jgi:hypothetical protein
MVGKPFGHNGVVTALQLFGEARLEGGESTAPNS